LVTYCIAKQICIILNSIETNIITNTTVHFLKRKKNLKLNSLAKHLPQVTDKLYHLMLYTSPWVGFELTTSVVIGKDCIGSCKSNYHTITAASRVHIEQSFIRSCWVPSLDKKTSKIVGIPFTVDRIINRRFSKL
jgi:hypothetical protein